MDYLRIRQAVIDQKDELENVFLSEKIIPRENLEIYGKLLDSDQIKVITGPRRAGSRFCAEKRAGGRRTDPGMLGPGGLRC